MTEKDIVHRPRKRAAAIYSLILIAALYALYKLANPGFPFSLLLAPVILGQGLLMVMLSWVGLEGDGLANLAFGVSWIAGALAMWYVYYKLVYFLLWLFGIHQPLRAGSGGEDAEMVRDKEGGWPMRVFLVSLFPAVIGLMFWQSATSYEGQHERQHAIVRAAAEVACKDNDACHARIESRFDDCFDAHFVERGRKWLRARYVVDREPFRACLFPARKSETTP
jgi:hypothetical protein